MADIAKTSKRVTVAGVTIETNPKVFDDMRVMDWLYQIKSAQDSGNGMDALAIVPLFRTLCGKKYEAIMKAIAEPDGRVPIEKATNVITEILEKTNPNS